MKKAVILANGHAPDKNVFKYLANAGYDFLICADGGADSALKLGFIPDAIIGDFDSIKKKTLSFYKPYSEIIRLKRQNDTDIEKCLKYCIKKRITDVILTGVTGDRLDHTFCNLGIVLKFYDKIKIKIIHEKSVLSAHSGKIELNTVRDEIISLYGFDAKTKIISSGLKYQLKNVPLPFGAKESTSNNAKGSLVMLNIKGGRIFIVREYKTVRDNGFLELY